ncbi:hypothetical protein KAR91_74030 [Candidatus Pacearchaeota archaeon]|nr:hypothetical protein [Candidatus Pacearchaeota archaeon]
MADSGYVLAGFETLATILNNFALRDTKKRFDNHFTPEQISSFLRTTCHGFLHSFGQNFTGKKTYDKYIDLEAKLYRQARSYGFFDGCTFIADSGGFQASIGRINPDETQRLIDLYHEFLVKHTDVIDRAFILDLPPGPGCKLFNTFDDIYDRNLETYTLAKNLPQEARDKVIYIHHFRTPKLWDIYGDILRSEGMFESFQYFGTGGIVANMASDTAIPCIIYVLPMIPLINQAIAHGRDKLTFHILGGANFRDILFYEMFQTLVREKHGVELEISYDSSGLFKGLMIGRFFQMIGEDGIIRKVDIRSQTLNKRFKDDKRVIDVYTEAVKEVTEQYDFKPISMDPVYDPDTGTFFEETKIYSMFVMLNMYAKVQQILRGQAKRLYPIYASGDREEFGRQVELVTRSINGGKISRKQKAKSYSLIKSLDMLSNLDENYCKYIVTKYLAKDEFSDLDPRTQVLTI